MILLDIMAMIISMALQYQRENQQFMAFLVFISEKALFSVLMVTKTMEVTMSLLFETCSQITPLDPKVMEAVQLRLDTLIKPQDSLGRLEEMVKQYAGIHLTHVWLLPAPITV